MSNETKSVSAGAKCVPTASKHYLDRLSYQTLSLGILTGLVTAIVLAINVVTKPAIAERLKEDKLQQLEQVMPSDRYNNDMLHAAQELDFDGQHYLYYQAKSDDVLSGYVLETSAYGYSGEIQLLIGVNPQLQITGVRVISHNETPGLGDKIELTKNPWVLSFNEQSLTSLTTQQWAVKKDGGYFDQFSGATITPRAVVKAVHQSLLLLADIKQMAPSTAGTQTIETMTKSFPAPEQEQVAIIPKQIYQEEDPYHE